MATYQYADTSGKLQTIDATSASEAMRLAPNIGSTSGVMLMPSTNTASATTLGKATAPTTASAVNNISTATMPDLKPTYGDPAKAIASNTAVSGLLQQWNDTLKAQNERDAQMAADNNSWLKQFFNQQTPQDYRQGLEKSMGVTKLDERIQSLITESESLTKDYNATVARRDEHIAKLEENSLGALERGVDSRVIDAEKYYAIKLNQKSSDINARAAMIQSMQGNLNSARDYINQAVSDYTAEKRDKLDAFIAFRQMNADLFDKIDSRYSLAYDNAIKSAQEDYNNTVDQKKTIGELMLKYNQYGAGITLSDSLEDAYRKSGSVAPAGEGADLTADMRNYNFAVAGGYKGSFADWIGKGGGSTTAGSFADIIQQAIDQDATPEQAAREAAMASEKMGTQVDQKTLSEWTAFAKTLTKTQQQQQTTEATISAPSGNYSSTPSGGGGVTLMSLWDSLFNSR